ncbi:MAG: DUF3368 domain-containing protein [Acidobacteria bacterium]|nr:DUF3368 domain-containing protein [Acidobacteriota bacterium]
MIVVSNTSPIVALDYLGRLDILKPLFGQVLIPAAVRQELRSRELPPSILVREVVGDPAGGMLQGLDRGESEAIALAIESEAHLILLDDFAARQRADRLGLSKLGIVGLLVRAKRERLIEAIGPEIERLMGLPFHLSPGVVKNALREAGE